MVRNNTLPAMLHRTERCQPAVDMPQRVSLPPVDGLILRFDPSCITGHDPSRSLLEEPSPRLSWTEFRNCPHYLSGKIAPLEGIKYEAND